jgi:virginiamycin A acetyltransferase
VDVHDLALWLYGQNRGTARRAALKLATTAEGGEFLSPTLREILRRFHGVDIGLYTHGGCFVPHAFGPRTTIGRYSSIARTAFAATLNHPMDHKSQHGYFFNPHLGYATEERQYSPLNIGSDVWLGHNSIIQPSVASVGDGAVVGAGAVVFKDVPPYAVVVGNPGRVVRYRFSPQTIERLLGEQWWTADIDELSKDIGAFTTPLEVPSDHTEPMAGGPNHIAARETP